MMKFMTKCKWCTVNEKMERYHDTEWGVPLFDDNAQFEFFSMEVMQCGLNWNMMLNKRDIFRACFDNFDYRKVAKYGQTDIDRIMAAENMIKSERKIRAVIHNAKIFVRIAEENGSFSKYLWRLADNKIHLYPDHLNGDLPAKNDLSEFISAQLKKQGFKFAGPVTVYSHLQACGIINDHSANCFRRGEVMKNRETVIDR